MKVLLNGAAAKKPAVIMLNNLLEYPRQAKGRGRRAESRELNTEANPARPLDPRRPCGTGQAYWGKPTHRTPNTERTTNIKQRTIRRRE
jgi:hypothetical protein